MHKKTSKKKVEKITKIIESVYGNHDTFPLMCPDQFAGKYAFSNNEFKTQETPRVNIDYSKEYNEAIIAIILESPHVQEYKTEPFGPAKGPTGKLFFNKFDDYLRQSKIFSNLSKSEYKIAFINSIQYQTSQGHPLNNKNNKLNRDVLWLKMFDDFGQKCLLERITLLKPKIVINLCTVGFSNLQLKVDRVLNNGNYIYTTGTHPATWNFNYAHIN